MQGALAVLHHKLYGNTVLAYLIAAAVFLATVWAFLVGRRLLLLQLRRWAARTATSVDDFAIELLERIRMPECYLVGLYFGTRWLALPPRFDATLRTVVLIVVAYRTVNLLSVAVRHAVRLAMLGDEADPSRRAAAQTLTGLLQFFLWISAGLFVLANLGFNITSMVAGLGIGGIAVALAAQAVLGDLFSAVAIFLDKPFEVGDFIIFEDAMGTVEQIGIKTTRIRSLSGELLVVANGQLTSTRIRNFKQMRERRVVFGFGVTYDATEEQLAAVPGLVKAAVEREPLLRFDRAHFMRFGDSSLDFEVVYWFLDPDYNRHMDAQQRVLLSIMRELRARGLEFAFPTRTVHVQGALAAARPA